LELKIIAFGFPGVCGAFARKKLNIISPERKVCKGFWGLKIIAFDLPCVLCAFARVKSFQSLSVIRCRAQPALALVTDINHDRLDTFNGWKQV
jgi:hypothetical protein